MKKTYSLIAFLLLATLLITFYGSNTNKQNEPPSTDDLQTNYLEGCIQRVGDTTFLVNDSKTVLQSTTISVETELIEGNNYKVEYQTLLESYPPQAEIIQYEQIEKNYCYKGQ